MKEIKDRDSWQLNSTRYNEPPSAHPGGMGGLHFTSKSRVGKGSLNEAWSSTGPGSLPFYLLPSALGRKDLGTEWQMSCDTERPICAEPSGQLNMLTLSLRCGTGKPG